MDEVPQGEGNPGIEGQILSNWWPEITNFFAGHPDRKLGQKFWDLDRGSQIEWMRRWRRETPPEADAKPDLINEPPHYLDHPSGVECITITEGFNFNKGNAIKYIWRAGSKGDEVTDLRKARWYLDDEIRRLDDAQKY